MEKQTPVGDIPNTNGIHGIAIAHQFGKGYISAGGDTAVTVFDLKTSNTLMVIRIPAIDATTLKMLARRPIAPGEEPSGAEIDALRRPLPGSRPGLMGY
ncbi:MAG TPA: hypothetical protein VJO14_04805 [Bacteroidota bacterium]|nr:hypothetical protein [Bacteroidota bacterium]